jgi:hypothetical protein
VRRWWRRNSCFVREHVVVGGLVVVRGRVFLQRLFVGRLFVERLFVGRLFVGRLFVERLFFGGGFLVWRLLVVLGLLGELVVLGRRIVVR